MGRKILAFAFLTSSLAQEFSDPILKASCADRGWKWGARVERRIESDITGLRLEDLRNMVMAFSEAGKTQFWTTEGTKSAHPIEKVF